MRARGIALLLLAAGCATPAYVVIDGKRVERPSVAYGNGRFFTLEHDRAYPGVFDPRRPQDVDDGTLRGHICGVDVSFDATWYGARLELQGRGYVPWLQDFMRTEGDFQLSLHIEELAPGRHRIRGELPPAGFNGPTQIDLDVGADALRGRIGSRTFDLVSDGEYLFGHVKRQGDQPSKSDLPYAIYGRHVLGTMVAADQALLLVMMLTCSGPAVEHQGTLVRGFSMIPLSDSDATRPLEGQSSIHPPPPQK